MVKLTTEGSRESKSTSRETRADFVITCTRQPSLRKDSRQARVSLSFASIGGYGSELLDMLMTRRLSILWRSRLTRAIRFFFTRYSKARGIKEVM